jgi:molybdopterin/thiamine biosynthesis adenylyltransferase
VGMNRDMIADISGRYQRQVAIEGFGIKGQKRLEKAAVLIAGVGGLGSIISIYLAAAGIGKLRIMDHDVVELNNLNRQILYGDTDIGKKKVEVAKQKLMDLNPNVTVETVCGKIEQDNTSQLAQDCDLIIDAMDNFTARYILNEIAIKNRIPFFHGAVRGFEGRATTIIPGSTPCLRCIYKNVPVMGASPVVGVTPAVIGSIQAMEVIKYIAGIGTLLTNRFLVFNGIQQEFIEIKLKRRPGCQSCGHLWD